MNFKTSTFHYVPFVTNFFNCIKLEDISNFTAFLKEQQQSICYRVTSQSIIRIDTKLLATTVKGQASKILLFTYRYFHSLTKSLFPATIGNLWGYGLITTMELVNNKASMLVQVTDSQLLGNVILPRNTLKARFIIFSPEYMKISLYSEMYYEHYSPNI